MTKLIYHTGNECKGDISPFDTAIIELVENQKIKIACPYISIMYLEKMIGLASDWLLISDIDEWLNSNNNTNREKIKDLIIDNKTKIHHCPNLHAKTIITSNSVLLGSANFTENGLTKKNEVSVILSESSEINEMTNWFNTWWNETDEADLEELKTIINELSSQEQVKKTVKKLTSKTHKIETVFSSSNLEFTEIEAKVIGLGTKYKDGVERIEIHINKKYENILPCVNSKRINIFLKLDKIIYTAGLRVTEQNAIIWICPDLKDLEYKKVRLVDLILSNGFNKNDKIVMDFNPAEKIFNVKKR